MSELASSARRPTRSSRRDPGARPPRPFPGTVAESLALAVAPSTGRFRPLESSGFVAEGQLLGHVTGGRGRADEVRTPVEGWLEALLVRPGQLVRSGQVLAWLRRTGENRA